MSARLRYLALTAARTRAALPPLAATLFAAIGVYAYPENEPRATFAVTALMACGLAAWFVGAVLAGEPEPQAEMASVALGGRSERTGLEVMLVAAVSAGVTIAFLAYPLALVGLGVPKVFKPPVQGADLAAGVLAHLCCAALGGTVGVLYAPPRLTRRATAVAAVLATLLALIAAASVLGPVGGPVAVASALSDDARATPLGGAAGRRRPRRLRELPRPGRRRRCRRRPLGPAHRIGEDARVTRSADDVRHPVFARMYAMASPGVERRGAAAHRTEMLDGIAGRVLELGAGNGLNFAHYPTAVTEVLAVEPEPYLRARATDGAARAAVPITVVAGLADALPAEDGAFDAAVASLVLCTVPDQPAALAELRRVVRPGGALHFYEHVVGTGRLATAQSWLDRSGVWPHSAAAVTARATRPRRSRRAALRSSARAASTSRSGRCPSRT